jgi:hypothetical protein
MLVTRFVIPLVAFGLLGGSQSMSLGIPIHYGLATTKGCGSASRR